MKRVNDTSRDKRRHLKGVYLRAINGLVRELHELAPHPAVNFSGPAFIKANALFNKAASYDSMLGAAMAENFLAGVFFDAANDNPAETSCAVNFNDAVDIASEYMEEQGEGQGSFARVKWRSATAAPAPGPEAWERDLPRRLNIESALAHYLRSYESLPVPAFA